MKRVLMVSCTRHNHEDGSTLIVLSGEVDLAFAPEITGEGLLALNSGCAGLVVDLMAVSFIDSTGLGALLGLRNAAEARGVELVVRDPSKQVLRLLEITNLTQVLTIERTTSPPR